MGLRQKRLFYGFAALVIGSFLPFSGAEAKPYTMKTLPKTGLNVDWPILKEDQYFSFKGKTANYVTLRYLIRLDCNKFIDMYDEDPKAIVDELMMLILVNLALRGVDITTMSESILEEEAFAHILKKLRQLGRIEEMEGMLKDPMVVPGLPGCCELLAFIKNDILQQRNHAEYQWDFDRRLNVAPAAAK